MPSGLLAVWPLYLVGSVIIFLGFLALHTWVRGLTGKGPDQPGSILAASALAFVIGAATVAIAIGFDQAQTTSANTRTLVYHVEVHIHGTPPVRVILPAPGEPAFFDSLNVTQGTSSMRLNHTRNDTSVVLTAATDVTFNVRMQVVTSVFNTTLTHVSATASSSVLNANATIRTTADGTNTTTADLTLQIQIVEACAFRTFRLAASLQEGTAVYPGTMTFGAC